MIYRMPVYCQHYQHFIVVWLMMPTIGRSITQAKGPNSPPRSTLEVLNNYFLMKGTTQLTAIFLTSWSIVSWLRFKQFWVYRIHSSAARFAPWINNSEYWWRNYNITWYSDPDAHGGEYSQRRFSSVLRRLVWRPGQLPTSSLVRYYSQKEAWGAVSCDTSCSFWGLAQKGTAEDSRTVSDEGSFWCKLSIHIHIPQDKNFPSDVQVPVRKLTTNFRFRQTLDGCIVIGSIGTISSLR